MKREILAWLFFIICCNALSYSLCESDFNSKAEDYKPLIKEKQLKDVNGMVIKSNKEGDQKAYELGVHEAFYLRNVQKGDGVIYQNKKGKGSYGGGDLLRPRNVKSGACSLLQKSPFLLSSALRHFAVALLILLFFC